MICDAPGEFNGGTWGSDGTIIFHQTEFGLREVSAQGGDSQPLAIPGAKSATVGSGFPAYLPDGQSFLNFVVREDGIGELVVDSGETSYTAVLMVGIASITGRYDARVTLADRVEPESYRLVVDAKGRPGFVRGEAHIKLADGTDGQTVVSVRWSRTDRWHDRQGRTTARGHGRQDHDGPLLRLPVEQGICGILVT